MRDNLEYLEGGHIQTQQYTAPIQDRRKQTGASSLDTLTGC